MFQVGFSAHGRSPWDLLSNPNWSITEVQSIGVRKSVSLAESRIIQLLSAPLKLQGPSKSEAPGVSWPFNTLIVAHDLWSTKPAPTGALHTPFPCY